MKKIVLAVMLLCFSFSAVGNADVCDDRYGQSCQHLKTGAAMTWLFGVVSVGYGALCILSCFCCCYGNACERFKQGVASMVVGVSAFWCSEHMYNKVSQAQGHL